MNRCLSIVIALIASCLPALAQTGTPTKQSGNVTPSHAACWTTNGIIQDCGTAAVPFLTSIGTVGQGQTICAWSALSTAPGSQKICLGVTDAGGASLVVQNFGTDAALPFNFVLNGITYPFPFAVGGIVGPGTSVIGDIAVWNNTTGSLLKDVPPLQIFGTESANCVFAGPTTGSAAFPTCRALVGADLPNPSATTLGGIESIAIATHQWIDSISTSGVPHQSQPAFPDISGQIAASQVSISIARIRLSGSTTFYFDSTSGVNQTGCGLNTGASACQTANFILNIIQSSYDLNGQAVTVQGACHTAVCAAINLAGPFFGGTSVTVQGDTTTPSNQVLDGTSVSSVYCVQLQTYAKLIVQGFKVQNCTNELSAIKEFAVLQFQQIEFASNTSSGTDIYCVRQSSCEVIGGGNIIDACASCGGFIQAAHQGNFRAAGANTGFGAFKFLGNTTWNNGFIYAALLGEIVFTGYTSGNNPFNLNATTVTGFSWVIDSNGTIEDEVINDPTFFPGSATGLLRGFGSFNGSFHEGTTISSGGGAGVAISGDDFNGTVVEGANSTGTTILFGSHFDTAPTCTVSYAAAPTSPTQSVSTTALTVGHSSATLTYTYNCHGG